MTRNLHPFLKWAGGKTQLLPVLDAFLPVDFSQRRDVVYIEPFVGGGAMLFHMLGKYPGIRKAVVNDLNLRLIKTYRVVQQAPIKLMELLSELERKYHSSGDESVQKELFLNVRHRFNHDELDDVTEAAYMIFLNKTCFNGLYRENSRGEFNVPFGKHKRPTICNADVLKTVSDELQRVTILHGDFEQTRGYAGENSFFYFDPPYRPVAATSNFNNYIKEAFNDAEQRRLKVFFAELSGNGCDALLSNSDGRAFDKANVFFDELYRDYIIERVLAKRSINSVASRRGALSELLIRNYQECQGIYN